jgi:hypothetical protein
MPTIGPAIEAPSSEISYVQDFKVPMMEGMDKQCGWRQFLEGQSDKRRSFSGWDFGEQTEVIKIRARG